VLNRYAKTLTFYGHDFSMYELRKKSVQRSLL
jgi:hypothetical protein